MAAQGKTQYLGLTISGHGADGHDTTGTSQFDLDLNMEIIDAAVHAAGGGSPKFDLIESGTNDSAAMIVGTGASLTHSGTGKIDATEINGIEIPAGVAATTIGKIPISQGDGTAAWADPLVQGIAAEGVATSGINPVLISGKGVDGNQHDIATDNSGQVKVLIENASPIPVVDATIPTAAAIGSAVAAALTNPSLAQTVPVDDVAGNNLLAEIALDTDNLAGIKTDTDTLAGAVSGSKVKVSAAAGDVVVEVSDGTNVLGTTLYPVQVALPAATVSTLTPPAAITGFALETGGNLAEIAGDTDNLASIKTDLDTISGAVSSTKMKTSASDGDVYVRSNAASTFPVAARITGNVGGILDAVVGAAVPANALQVAGSDGTDLWPIAVDPYGKILAQSTSTIGDPLVEQRLNQMEINFTTAFLASQVTNATFGTGAAAQGSGCATFATGTGASGETLTTSVQSLLYHPAHEWYCYFTAAFTTPTDSTNTNYQRIGLYSPTTNGFFIGYEKNVFGFSQLQNSSITQVAQASWNGDLLNGAAGSKFRSSGVPVAIDLTKINIWRIRGTWFGAAPVMLEVFSPDGVWVMCHTFKFPNTLTTPYMYSTTLPWAVDVKKASSDSTNLIVTVPCCAFGTTTTSPAILSLPVIATWNQFVPADSATAVNLANYSNVMVTLHYSGTVTGGQIYFEVSDDNTNWYHLTMAPIDQDENPIATDNYILASANGNMSWQMFVGGYSFFRVRQHVAVVGTGQAITRITASTQPCEPAVIAQVYGTGANGSPVQGDPVLIAGSDGTDVRTIATDTNGLVKITGGLTNNNAAPTTTNVGVLPAVANAAAPTWTEGDQVLLSEDLSGHLRVVATGAAATGAAAVGNPLLVAGQDYAGNAQPLATDTTGKQRIVGATMNPQIVQGSLALGALTNVALASTTCVKAYGKNVTLGNTLVVMAAVGSVQVVTVTDSLNLQWQTITMVSNGFQATAYCALVTVAGTPTITVTSTGSTDIAMALYEIEGAGSIDGLATAVASTTGTAVASPCAVAQPGELGFMMVSAGAATISATSPASPASIVFDSANIALAGATTLKNFGAFSGQMGYPITNATATSSGNTTNTFKATLSGSVAYAAATFAFKPVGIQSSGFVQAQTLGGQQVTDSVAASSLEGWVNYTTGFTLAVAAVGPMLFNGATLDRQRTPAIFRSAMAGSAAANTIWTPASAAKFHLMRYKIEGTANLSETTAGIIPIYLADGVYVPPTAANPTQTGLGMYLMHSVFIPSTTATTLAGAWDSDWIDLGNGYTSTTANALLQLCINGPLASTTVNAGFTQTSGAWQAMQVLLKTNQQTAAGVSAQLVQMNQATPLSGISIVKAWSNPNIGGNTLVIVASCNNGAVLTISDGAGNSWTSLTQQTTGSAQTMRVFVAVNCKASVATAVTVSQNGSAAQMKMLMYEYTGVSAADSNSGTTGSSTTPAPGNATAAATSDLVLSFASNAGNANTISAAGAFRLIGSSTDANGALAAEDNLNQLPAGLAGAFNVVAVGTEG